MPSKTTIQIRKGASKSWESSNPVLQQGELVFVQDKNQIKIGDGVSNYNELPGIVFDGGDLDNPIATNTLYFTGSVDNNWSNAGNWFSDSAGTVAAGGIPATTDNVVILSSVQNVGSNPTVANMIANGAVTVDPIVTVNGIATFNDTTTNSGTVNGNAIFNDNSSNDGTVAGNATFNATSTNEGSVTGTATFNGSSINTSTGTVGGNANFNDNSVNEGDVTGTATFTGNSYNDGGTAGTFVPNPPPSTPSTTPGAPTITGITSGDGQLTVAFTAPNSNGGSAITNYKYSTNGGSTFTAVSPAATTSPITITGLNNGTSYNVQIRAVNANGDGTATGSTSATPAAPTSSSSSSSSSQAIQALGRLPVGQAGGQGDPFFTLARIAPCNPGEEPFFAQWEDNGTECINRMLFVHLETLRYTLTIYHTNKILPGVDGSVIDSVEVVYNGQSTVYNSNSSLNTRFNGDIALQLVSSSFQGSSSSSSISFLQMNFSWVRQINDVVTLGGGVGVVLKKVIQEGGYWESPTGNDVNGFGLAGAFINITRADLEAAASAGPATSAWSKVMFPGVDFNALTAIAGVCRPPMVRLWDLTTIATFDDPPGKPCESNAVCSYCRDTDLNTGEKNCGDLETECNNVGGTFSQNNIGDCTCVAYYEEPEEGCSKSLLPGPGVIMGWSGYCCGGMCYPHELLCTIQSVKEYNQGCIDSGLDSQTCCGDSAYSVSYDPVSNKITCSSPFPTCSNDNINPAPHLLKVVPEGFSVINCS